MIRPIYSCLWFDGKAREAAEFYCGLFPNSGIISENPMIVMFRLNGVPYMGLNGGPQFRPNEACSFVVECETQKEIDFFWEKLTSDGGEESRCGWLKDKYGFSWQIIPNNLGALFSNPERAQRVGAELLKMNKLIKAVLDNA